jgi:outer membrane receptor protein involved in Fe transport
MGLRIELLIIAFILCVSFPGTRASAQTSTTGTIEGIVADSNGAVVPAVTVTVTSPNLIRAQSATTDNEGRYCILNLPPGRYTVTVEATAGFARFARASVEVNLSKTSTVLIQLEPADATATVTVSNTSGAAVDTTSNTGGTSVSNEQFSNFTTQRTVQSLYTIAPSVARSGLRDPSGRDRDPSVAGSSGLENGYVLDGVNTTDPAYGGSGANLPFEFIQEVDIKTGAYGAEYGLATGGIFNVLTKSGGNDLHGDVFAYFSTKGLVRATKYFPFTGSAPNGFSELDAGFDLGGPIKKDKLWFFGAFNPQRRENSYFTQTLRQTVSNKITTPFYAGKLTYALNQRNTLTFSTFGDFTKIVGFRASVSGAGDTVRSGFAADLNSFITKAQLLGGNNYAIRLNSTITPKWIGEFAFGAHFQRNNSGPPANMLDKEPVTDNFAILRNGAVLPVTDTNVNFGGVTGFLAFVDGRGGSLERGFVRGGYFGLVNNEDRDRYEAQARLQNIFGRHTLKYGFEFTQNRYRINQHQAGPTRDFGAGVVYKGFNVTNNFGVCTAQGSTIVCPAGGLTNRVNALIAAGQAPAGITSAITNTGLTAAQISTNPFLIRSTTSISNSIFDTRGDFIRTNVESFYIQDDFRFRKNVQFNVGLRWDYQQLYDAESTYLKLDSFKNNLEPRLGLIWDFTGKGKGKLFVNHARFLEAPIPVSLNLFAGRGDVALLFGAFVNRLNAPAGSTVTVNNGGGSEATPVDPDLKPQTVNETAAGMEYEIARDLVLGFRCVYRAQRTVIEDGSFDEGNTFFLFNPGEGETERLACASKSGCFGHARRYYRALEITATKRFTTNYQFIASYVYSSLIGNYEGFYRNDTGQASPNFTTLFDLQSLLANQYGRLPNDRPNQLKFDGSYRTPWKLLVSVSFRAQSGIPFNALIPQPGVGNNEGVDVPRGTAINPVTGRNRTPTTYNLDLGAHYPIKLGESRQLRIQVDWLNVFNDQRAVRQDETVRISSGSIAADRIEFPNPFYGQGTIFQYPSSLRLGVKFQF